MQITDAGREFMRDVKLGLRCIGGRRTINYINIKSERHDNHARVEFEERDEYGGLVKIMEHGREDALQTDGP